MTNRYLGVDPVLTNVAIGYTNEQYIAELVLPSFSVAKQTGKHFVYDRGRFRGPANNAKRAQGANSSEVSLVLTTGNPYFCEDHALKQFVADEDVDNAITPTSPYQDATENTVDRLLIGREIEAATLLTTAANFATGSKVTLTGTDQWNDYTNSDPIGDIETGKTAIHDSIFQMPNTLVLGKQVYDQLIHHPAIIERVKYSQLGVVTPQLLAAVFDVERVIIAKAGKNTSIEGQSDTMGYIWGKIALLAYVAPKVGPKVITLGLNYVWAGKSMQVKRLRGTDEEDREGTYIRAGRWYYDQNIVASEAGYLISGAVA